ncbi:MAG: response regulator [Betaproteobacteria bacterium]|nr:response regulator [Betaproteobacteria bacterium]
MERNPAWDRLYRVLVADDEPSQRHLAMAILAPPKYHVALVSDGLQAVERLHGEDFDAVLLDKRMPLMDGFAVLSHIRGKLGDSLLPVIMVTGHGDSGDDVAEALRLGATDFIRKPYDPLELVARVDAAVAHKRLVDQLEDAESILFAQARMAEARDRHTGDHVARVARNAVLFGQVVGLSGRELNDLRRGAVLHDIGKLGIPDAILLKPGRLTDEEWSVMRSHSVIGERLVSGMRSMREAATVIRSHHERWDGGGYPDGLKGESIPLLARLFQLVDIHDALSCERPYKEALTPTEVARLLEDEAACRWRDPDLTVAFLRLLHERPRDLIPAPDELEDLGQSIFQDILRTGALTWDRTHGATT